MCDKNIESEKEELQEVELTSDEMFVEIEVNKEISRMNKEIVYTDVEIKKIIKTDEFKKGSSDANYLCGRDYA